MLKLIKCLSIASGFCVVMIIGYVAMKSFIDTRDTKPELIKDAEKIGNMVTEAAGAVIKGEATELIYKGRVKASELKPRFEDALMKIRKSDKGNPEGSGVEDTDSVTQGSFAKNEGNKQDSKDEVITETNDDSQKLDSAQKILLVQLSCSDERGRP